MFHLQVAISYKKNGINHNALNIYVIIGTKMKDKEFMDILMTFDIKKVSDVDKDVDKIKKNGFWFMRMPKDLKSFRTSWKLAKKSLEELNKRLNKVKSSRKKSTKEGKNA